jgi:hypothetical protein
LSRRRASTSPFGIAMIRPPHRHRRLVVSARSNATRRQVPHTATSPIRRTGPLPPDVLDLGFTVLHRTRRDGTGRRAHDHVQPHPRLARRSPVDKKAKTPKKPKTAKPKGSTTTR